MRLRHMDLFFDCHLDSDAPAHHARVMKNAAKKTTLRVTTKDMGVREVTLNEKTARFYKELWVKEGHKVETL